MAPLGTRLRNRRFAQVSRMCRGTLPRRCGVRILRILRVLLRASGLLFHSNFLRHHFRDGRSRDFGRGLAGILRRMETRRCARCAQIEQFLCTRLHGNRFVPCTVAHASQRGLSQMPDRKAAWKAAAR